MKKAIILLLLSIPAFAQEIKFKDFEYSDPVMKKVKITDIPEILLDRSIEYNLGGKKKGSWLFASESEFEEIRGGKVYDLNGRFIYPVIIIAHDYKRISDKYYMVLNLVYLDNRNGLQLDEVNTLEFRPMQ